MGGSEDARGILMASSLEDRSGRDTALGGHPEAGEMSDERKQPRALNPKASGLSNLT